MSKKKKFYSGNCDGVFKAIFCSENNTDLLKRLIEEVILKRVEIINITTSELPKSNVVVRGKVLDILVKTDQGIINIELIKYSDPCFRKRNAAYIFKKYSDSVEVGKSYQNIQKHIQINLTSPRNDEIDIPLKAHYRLYDGETKTTFINNLDIFEINLTKMKEICYNENVISLLSMLEMDYSKLKNVKGDKLMEKFRDQVIELNQNEEFIKFLSDEKEAELIKNSFIQMWEERGREEGKEEGIEQRTIEIASAMLKENADESLILKVTGLTNEELNKLKENL